MRRSKHIKLALVASVSATVILAGCEDAPDSEVVGEFFTSKAECAVVFTETECEKAENEAIAAHLKNAPEFATREACEAEFGPDACRSGEQIAASTVTAPAGSSNSFFPFLVGYMMASGSNGPLVSPMYYGAGSYRTADRNSRPLYSSGGYAGVSKTPVGYSVSRNGSIPTTNSRAPASRSVVMTPSRSTGARPTSTTISKGLSRAGSRVSVSSRGGFGSVGRGFGGSFS